MVILTIFEWYNTDNIVICCSCFHCFDTVGWASVSNEVLVWLSVWSKVQIVYVWSS